LLHKEAKDLIATMNMSVVENVGRIVRAAVLIDTVMAAEELLTTP